MMRACVGRPILPEDWQVWTKIKYMEVGEQMKAIKEDKVSHRIFKQRLGKLIKSLPLHYNGMFVEFLEMNLKNMIETGETTFILDGGEEKAVKIGELL